MRRETQEADHKPDDNPVIKMDLLLDQFLGVLEGEADLYGSLLQILQREKEAVIGSALDELNETSKEKENILLKIRILEEQRLRILDRLANSLGYSPQDLTLTKLSQLVNEPYSKRLKDCHSNFLALIQSIKEVNKSNRALLMHSLDLVRGSLSLMDTLMVSNPVYYRTGMVQSGGRSGRVLSGKV